MATRSFDDVFVSEYPKLVAFGASVSGDREVARDLAQETMLRAHGRWDALEQYEQPGAWLRRVMSNLLIDHHRSCSAEAAALDRLRAAAPTDADAVSVERWSDVIAPLPPQQRIVATLFYADDLAVADIADALGISVGSVKSALSKVRETLRRHHDSGGAP